MAKEQWFTEMLAQGIRRDLDRLPPKNMGCFYGNPLGEMSKGAKSWIPEHLGIATGSAKTVWEELTGMAQFPEGDPRKTSSPLANLSTSRPDLFKLLCFWEWLLSLEVPSDTRRLTVLQMTEKFLHLLWGGYEIAMLRALEFMGKDEDDAVLSHILALDDVLYARQVAEFLFQIDDNTPFVLKQVPLHVGLLAMPILERKDVGRSVQPFQKLSQQWGKGLMTETSSGLRMRDWCGRGKRSAARHGRGESPTAQLIVAAGIEKFLRSQKGYGELMEKALQTSMNSVISSKGTHQFSTPSDTAKQLGLGVTQRGSRYAMTNTTRDTFSLIKKANAVWVNGEIQIEFSLAHQDWMRDQFLDSAVVIQTRGHIDGKRQTEAIYAAVLSAEDDENAGESNEMMAVRVCMLFSQSPLLNLWTSADPDQRSISGVVTLWNVESMPRVVLGLDVYLGEMVSPSPHD